MTSTYWQPRLPLIPILRGIRPDEVLAHVEVLIDAGFDAIEIPLNSPDWEVSIASAVHRFGAQACIGGGTVLQTSEVDRLHSLGAKLIVAPNTRPTLIRHAVQRQLIVMPGVATPSEAFDAIEAGAHGLKIFPASVYGPEFVGALRPVLPPIPLYAVGGISPDNLRTYLAAGCTGAGLGSHLYRPQQPVARTAAMAKAYLEAFRESSP